MHTESGPGHGTGPFRFNGGEKTVEMNRSCTILMGLFTPNTHRAVVVETAIGTVFRGSLWERFYPVWDTDP